MSRLSGTRRKGAAPRSQTASLKGKKATKDVKTKAQPEPTAKAWTAWTKSVSAPPAKPEAQTPKAPAAVAYAEVRSNEPGGSSPSHEPFDQVFSSDQAYTSSSGGENG